MIRRRTWLNNVKAAQITRMHQCIDASMATRQPKDGAPNEEERRMRTTPAWDHMSGTIQALLDDAAARLRYWTVSAPRWEALCLDAEAYGMQMPVLLRAMGLRIADRSIEGDVHLGARSNAWMKTI